MKDYCPICQNNFRCDPEPQNGRTKYSCATCGEFTITHTALQELGTKHYIDANQKKQAVLSHATFRISRRGEPAFLDSVLVDRILERSLPSPAEQANNFILWLGDELETPGNEQAIEAHKHKAVTGSLNSEGFSFVVNHLMKEGFVDAKAGGELRDAIRPADSTVVCLSFSGWDRYEELKSGSINSRTAFMAMQFDNITLDKIVQEHFVPAVSQTGYRLEKVTDQQGAGLIDDQIRVKIRTSRFIIADLSDHNNGSYWEAGFAEGLGKPVIYTCEQQRFKEGETHFDTNHHLTVMWDRSKPSEAADQLKATIRATLPHEAKLTED